MVRKLISFVAVGLLCAAPTLAQAGILGGITVSTGTQVDVGTINLFEVSHNNMTGIVVTAYFSDNTSQSDTFKTVGVGDTSFGIAEGSKFRLTQEDDTFEEHAWNIANLSTNSQLVKLVIQGAPGKTIFDLKGDGALPLTPGRDSLDGGTLESERGWTFDPLNLDDQFGVFPDLTVTAEYSDIVKRSTDASPVGDIWATLTVNFGGAAGGLPLLFGGIDQSIPFRFYADTDVFDFRDDAVPEPSSLVLMAGLGLAGAWRMRRSTSKRARAE